MVEVATQAQRDEIARYELGTHGLVGLAPTGELRVKIPGHEFGRVEITTKIDELLR